MRRSIIIGFSTPKKFKIGSYIIRCFENSEYSHIYIRMKTKADSPLPFDKVFQASHGDVNAVAFDVFKEGNKIFHEYEIEVEESKYFDVYKWLWFQLGKPYGFTQLLGIGLNLKLKSNNDKKFICSELSGMILRDHLGFDISDSLEYIGLNDIRYILEEMENK